MKKLHRAAERELAAIERKAPPFENSDAPMWTRLQRRLAEAAKAEIERQHSKARCPHCGYWLSTRYSASQPHQCKTVGFGVPPAPPADPDHARSAASPAHALAQPARYPEPTNRPNAPAGPARALVLAWLLGALCGGFVGFLAGLLWLPS